MLKSTNICATEHFNIVSPGCDFSLYITDKISKQRKWFMALCKFRTATFKVLLQARVQLPRGTDVVFFTFASEYINYTTISIRMLTNDRVVIHG